MPERSPETKSAELIGLTPLTDEWLIGVEIWHIDLDAALTHYQRVEGFLSNDERKRAANFVQSNSREQFVLVRGLLREILSARINSTTSPSITASSLQFSYNRFGKPSLSEYADWQFNVAHSGNSALIIVAPRQTVGIDLQWCNPDIDIEKMIKIACSTCEQSLLQALDKEKRHAMFFQLWTLKEAYVKAIGHGLALKLTHIDVSSAINESAFPLTWNEVKKTWSCERYFELHLLQLPLLISNGYKAAVAIEKIM